MTERTETALSSPAPVPLLRIALAPLLILLGSNGIDYLSHVLFGRWLGEADYGDFGVAVSAATFFAYLATLGADESVPRFLPKYLAEKRHSHAMGFVRAHLMIVTAVGAAIGVAGTVVFAILRRQNVEHPMSEIWWIVPLIALAEFLYQCLLSLERTAPAMLGQLVLWPLVALGVAASFSIFGGGLDDHRTVIAYGVGVAALLPVHAVLLRRAMPRDVWRAGAAYDARLWVRTAAPMLLATVAYYGLGQTDIYVMEHVGDEREVGMLLACVKSTDFIYLAFSAAYLVVAPRVSPLVEANRHEELRHLVRRITVIVFGVSSVVAIVVVLLGERILGWFGAGFVAGYPALVVLAISDVVIATLSLAWPLLSLAGHERVPLPGLVAALAGLAISAELAVPRFGMLGAAVCRGVVMIALFGWLAYQAKKRLGVTLWQLHLPAPNRRSRP
jgi:O-antigen/teichoic acid export membrane protein